MATFVGTKGDNLIIGTSNIDLIFSGSGDDTIDGGGGNDLILAGNGDDTVDGGDGNDLILAGNGDDIVTGGAGNDLIDGGNGVDTVNLGGVAQDHSFDFLGGIWIVTDLTRGEHDFLKNVEFLKFDNAEFVLDGSNNAPIADDVVAEVHEDGPPVVGDLLAESSAFDFEGDTLTVVAVNGDVSAVGNQIVLASGALLTVNADGSYGYDPNGQFEALNSGETGTDTATFALFDGTNTVSRTVTFHIEGEDDNVAPVANDVFYSVGENSAGGTYYFNANDADADDSPSTLQYHSDGMQEPPFVIVFPNQTTDFLNPVTGGTFSIVPGADLDALIQGEIKQYTFTYTAKDSHGAESNEATVTIEVIGENDAPARPAGIAFGVSVLENSGVIDVSFGVDDPDSDDNGASLTYVIQPTTDYTIFDNGDGSYSVDTDDQTFDHLAEGQSLTVTFTFDAIDQHGASTQFTNSNLEIVGVNDAPVATADSFVTDEDTAVVGNLFTDNGTGADSDVDDGDMFLVTEIDGASVSDGDIVELASGALLTISADGTFLYDPNSIGDIIGSGDIVSDSFEYTIEDSYGGIDTAVVTVEISGISSLQQSSIVPDDAIL